MQRFSKLLKLYLQTVGKTILQRVHPIIIQVLNKAAFAVIHTVHAVSAASHPVLASTQINMSHSSDMDFLPVDVFRPVNADFPL